MPKPITLDSNIRYAFQRGYFPLDDKEICWYWKRHSNRDKDGRPVVDVTDSFGFTVHFMANRVSYMIHNNLEYLAGDILVLHSCHNEICINPYHLYLGTNAQNSQDMVDADRQAKGEDHGNAILSDKEVLEIKKLLFKGWPLSKIAAKYRVGKSTISRVKNGKSWKHILYNPWKDGF